MNKTESFAGKAFYITLLLITINVCMSATANCQTLPADKVTKVAKELGKLPRYMEEDINDECKPTELAGWENFPLIKCTYRQPDKIAGYKKATVIMLNPKKDVLAKWIVASCVIVKKMPTPATDTAFDNCTSKLRREIIGASNAQFPVAGIVLEDQYPINAPDGIQEVYTFRDGLTVEVKDGLVAAFTGNFGEAENNIALDTARKITKAKNYARIQSTSRDEYSAYMGSLAEKVDGANSVNWVSVIRKLYQDAWTRSHSNSPENVEKYRNDLMVARCYKMLGVKPPER